jgi:hypothetical protein
MDIIAAYPQQRFLPAGYFAYDASEDVINYDPGRIHDDSGKLALLHEIAHSLLGHFHYRFDFELYAMEMDAWNLTRNLALQHNIKIDENYLEQCMNSYDEWLTERGTCPNCEEFNVQSVPNRFQCFRCRTRWEVSEDVQSSVKRKIIQ